MTVNRGGNFSGIEWRDEERAARGIGRDPVAVRKIHTHARRESAVHIENSQGRVFARHDFPRKQQDARPGRGRRIFMTLSRRTRGPESMLRCQGAAQGQPDSENAPDRSVSKPTMNLTANQSPWVPLPRL